MAVRERRELARFPVAKLMLQQKRMGGGVCRNMGKGEAEKRVSQLQVRV